MRATCDNPSPASAGNEEGRFRREAKKRRTNAVARGLPQHAGPNSIRSCGGFFVGGPLGPTGMGPSLSPASPGNEEGRFRQRRQRSRGDFQLC